MASTPTSQATTPKRASKMASQSLNVNHLLNFTLPPRQVRAPANIPRRSRKTGTHQGVWNKERTLPNIALNVHLVTDLLSPVGFVNAQYRFVMNPTGDYTVHFADPDMCVFVMHYRASHSNVPNSFFQWHDILQVIIPRTSALASAASSGESELDEGNTSCPICLSPPTAPRMTKCGHVSPAEISSSLLGLTVLTYRCFVFPVSSTTSVHRTTNGPGVQSVSTLSMRGNSRVSNGTTVPSRSATTQENPMPRLLHPQ